MLNLLDVCTADTWISQDALTNLFPSAAEHGFSGDAELVPDPSPEAGSGDHLTTQTAAAERISQTAAGPL